MRVWVNGAFDILHIGHIKLLKYAAAMGYLRVGIDTDERIKELKGPTRPFNNFNIRKELLQSLRFVDDVIGFGSEQELIDSIKTYAPDVMVVGSDYKNKRVIGAEHAKQVVYFDRIADISTTKILEYEKDISDR
jgi:D-beta-D-heptose 7-phosphate kinase/D-beta-D-heptose 1-phosphate adenosyltransferase